MRTMTRTCLAAAMTTLLLGGGPAGAQDADLQAQIEAFQQQYEQAVAAGDWAAISAMFTEDATFLPMTGGTVEGRSGVQGYYEQSGQAAVDIQSSTTEMLGENLILDAGTFTLTLSEEAGGMEVPGEYVSIGEVGEGGIQIRHLMTFPVRQPPTAPAQE